MKYNKNLLICFLAFLLWKIHELVNRRVKQRNSKSLMEKEFIKKKDISLISIIGQKDNVKNTMHKFRRKNRGGNGGKAP